MGGVDDVRKVLQDVVAPDLKAIDARITALEKRLDYRVDGLDKKIDFRVDELEKRMSLRFDILDQKIDLKHEATMSQFRSLAEMIKHNLDLDRRLERIERIEQVTQTKRGGAQSPATLLDRTA